jgi:hypothetical protein
MLRRVPSDRVASAGVLLTQALRGETIDGRGLHSSTYELNVSTLCGLHASTFWTGREQFCGQCWEVTLRNNVAGSAEKRALAVASVQRPKTAQVDRGTSTG